MTLARPPSLTATPPEAPLDMPTQSLSKAPKAAPIHQRPATYLARLIAYGGAALLAWYGYAEMTRVFGNETSTPLQGLLLALFTVTFGWIAFSATQGIASVLAPRHPRDDDDKVVAPKGRTALLMPVYNEDPSATCAALQAMGEGLADLGVGGAFEISSCPTPPIRRSGCARPPVSPICAPRWPG